MLTASYMCRLYIYSYYPQYKFREKRWNNKEILLKINKYSEKAWLFRATSAYANNNFKKSLLFSHIHVKCVLWHLFLCFFVIYFLLFICIQVLRSSSSSDPQNVLLRNRIITIKKAKIWYSTDSNWHRSCLIHTNH